MSRKRTTDVKIVPEATTEGPVLKIVEVRRTDYPTSGNRGELQAICNDLNKDAVRKRLPGRWMIIANEVSERLFKTDDPPG